MTKTKRTTNERPSLKVAAVDGGKERFLAGLDGINLCESGLI